MSKCHIVGNPMSRLIHALCLSLSALWSPADWEETAGCFALFVYLVSRDCCVALPHVAIGLSSVCDCGIS